jgi:putative IMPACT (imprinted ancient) family translation regulator
MGLAGVVRGPRTREGACRFAAGGVRLGPGDNPKKAAARVARRLRMHKASHVSWACRTTHGGRTDETKSDGGESGAGNVILDVLRKSSANNVLVVVARWYGGRHLGGLRFRVYSKLTSATLTRLGGS